MRRILISLIVFLCSTNIFSQQDIIKQFISDTSSLYYAKGILSHKFFPENILEKHHLDRRLFFLKIKNETFCYLDGTGRVYQLKVLNNEIKITRIDSTIFFGYNIGSFGFSYQNKLYNFGGYGIWRYNGHLREYNTKAKEWDIVKLNQEVPIKSFACLLYFDKNQDKIYIGRYSSLNEGVRKENFVNEWVCKVMVLDLVTKNWTLLGNLASFIETQFADIVELADTPFGKLVNVTGSTYVLDYKNNLIYKIEDAYNDKLINFLRNKNEFHYVKDSMIIFFNATDRKIDTLTLHKNEFIRINEKIYKPNLNEQTANKFSIYFIPAIIILLALAIFIFNKKSKKIKTQYASLEIKRDFVQIKDLVRANTCQIFNEKELQVLKLIINNSYNNKKTIVEELNTVLGVSKKSVEIQKKSRSDVILSINEKYSIHSNNRETLIKRQKNDFDGRVFEYFMDNKLIDGIQKLISI